MFSFVIQRPTHPRSFGLPPQAQALDMPTLASMLHCRFDKANCSVNQTRASLTPATDTNGAGRRGLGPDCPRLSAQLRDRLGQLCGTF